jgi:hypothetical protein
VHGTNEEEVAVADAPHPGDLVQVRTRHWLVEERVARRAAGEQTLVRLVGVDDDNSERQLAVLWERKLDARIVRQAAFDRLRERGFDAPEIFAGHLASPLDVGAIRQCSEFGKREARRSRSQDSHG